MRYCWLLAMMTILAGCSQGEFAMPGDTSAMAPRASQAADGRMLLSWIESGETGSRLKYSFHDGNAWSEAATAAAGTDWFNNWADTAGVIALDNGLLVAHWLVKNGESTYAYEVRYSVSGDMGKTWSEPRRAHDDSSASEHGFVSVVPRGDGFEMYWLDGRKTQPGGGHEAHAAPSTGDQATTDDGEIAGMTLRMGRFAADGERLMEREIDGLTCDCCPTDATRHGDDSLVVYRDRDEQEIRDIYLARISAGGEIERREVHDDAWKMPACPVNGPSIAISGERIHVLWFTGAEGERSIRHAVSQGNGEFATTEIAGGDAQGRVSLLDTGEALYAMWLAGQGSEGRIMLARLVEGEAMQPITVDGMSVARRVGYPQLGVLPDGELLVSWTTEQGLAGRRIAP